MDKVVETRELLSYALHEINPGTSLPTLSEGRPMSLRRIAIGIVVVAFMAHFGFSKAQAQAVFDLDQLGEDLAGKIAPKIIAKAPATGRLRVAVFPFGDKAGKATVRTGISPLLTQNAVSDALRPKLATAAPGKFSVVDPSALQSIFDTVALAPQGISPSDADAARKIMAKVKLDVGIVGTFDFDDSTPLSGAGAVNAVKVSLTAIYADGSDSCDSSVSTRDLILNGGVGSGDPAVTPSGRFGVRIFYKPDDTVADSAPGAWEEIPLQISKDPKSDSFNVYFLVLDPKKHKGKRYKVVLKNAGKPRTPNVAPQFADEDRMFAVALLIDGVNSIYQGPNGGPVVVMPSFATKWVLTAPGRQLLPLAPGERPNTTPRTAGLTKSKLVTVNGDGNSVAEVPGFQKDAKFADAFIFSDADASIAETLGITDSVGMISAHFFPEVLPDEPAPQKPGPAGTTTNPNNPPVAHPIIDVGFPVSWMAREAIRIFYRYDGDPDIAKNLTPVTGP